MNNLILHSLQPHELKQLISEAVSQAVDKTIPQPPDDDEELIKVSDASKLLGVSKVTIHAWKRDGLIPFYRISNKIYFKKNELIDSLKKSKQRGEH
ncbi:helix-turn-helix domain-containing protein [Bacteroidota bacterium]